MKSVYNAIFVLNYLTSGPFPLIRERRTRQASFTYKWNFLMLLYESLQVDHTMYTYLMGPDGELVQYYGRDWKANEMTDSIATHITSHKNYS